MYEFSQSIHIADIHLNSGQYYIKVSISDGFNEVSQFIELSISEIPLELKETYVLTKGGVNQGFDLYSVDGNSTVFSQHFNGGFQSGISNSFHQHLLLSGDQGGYGYDPLYSFKKNQKNNKVLESYKLKTLNTYHINKFCIYLKKQYT